MNLGAALRRTGDVNGALVALKEATRLAPRDADGVGQPGHGAVGQEELRRGAGGARQGDQAEARLRAGLEPAGARRAQARASSCPAVAAQEKARKLEPKNGAFAADLCRALIEQKQAPRAVAECKAAVDLEPKNPLAHYELMKALVAKGDCGAAPSRPTPASRRCRSSPRPSSRPTPSWRPARSSGPATARVSRPPTRRRDCDQVLTGDDACDCQHGTMHAVSASAATIPGHRRRRPSAGPRVCARHVRGVLGRARRRGRRRHRLRLVLAGARWRSARTSSAWSS